MPKLTTILEYRKDGSTYIKGYRTSFSKVEIEKHNLQDMEFDVVYGDNRIVLINKKISGDKEKVIDYILDLFISNLGEATKEKQEEMNKNIDLYINDMVRGYIDEKCLKYSEEEINSIIEEVIKRYYII